MVFYNDELTLYTKTSNESTKVEEIKNNPYAYILLGYNETTNNSFVEIEANIEIVEDQKVIDWLWKRKIKRSLIQRGSKSMCA